MHKVTLLASMATVALSTVLMILGNAEAQQTKRLEASHSKEIPDSWPAFKVSSNPDDKRLVAIIEKMKWWEVCRDWGREARAKKESRRLVALREFLLQGDTINGIDLMHVSERNVAVGMTACGVIASLGLPDTINYTTTASHTGAQMVYRSRGVYVYTDAAPNNGNGIVRSVQH
ncbi:MAG: hypothetical protein QMD73_04085 [Rhodocyclaceae bacterium]|nr:hypothetical protein [Rhodocyclaceae bacterium]